ncbi:MAG: GAF domain-containing protein, partial [Bdellovibrionales bacterium]|nr:GAF domain-containing protein [Bdellovibrionales bacterium]
EQLNEIGAALTAEKNLDQLLRLIVKKARKILTADAACLYLVDHNRSTNQQQLKFTCSSYDIGELNLFESYLDISTRTVTGYVALKKQPVRLENIHEITLYPFEFQKNLDTDSLYPFQSVIAYPLINRKAELIGVIEIWNKKNFRKVPITFDNFEEMIIPFTHTDESILKSVTSQATVAIQNAKLYENISELFDGFIRASVTAIEARDPTTYGHSERVAKLTLGLCDELHYLDHGPFRSIYFTNSQLKEIEYAALLHDFGKIGVRESVLTKARKLFDFEISQVKDRIDLWKQTKIIEYQQKKIDHILREGKLDEQLFHEFEKEYLQQFRLADQAYALLLEYNEPSNISEDDLKIIGFLSELYFQRPSRREENILSSDQIYKIRIRHGSLSPDERKAIESHVTYTFHFLKQIPWVNDLKGVPDIAHAHHEKLDGSGYPQGLVDKQIPFPAKIMAVADVFDALVSRDRPYKKAISVKDALNILVAEGARNKLDAELINVFIQKSVYSKVLPKKQ